MTLGSAQQHLKIRLQHGFEVLVWNQADKISLKDCGHELQLLGHLGKNEFRNSITVQFIGEFVEIADDGSVKTVLLDED